MRTFGFYRHLVKVIQARDHRMKCDPCILLTHVQLVRQVPLRSHVKTSFSRMDLAALVPGQGSCLHVRSDLT